VRTSEPQTMPEWMRAVERRLRRMEQNFMRPWGDTAWATMSLTSDWEWYGGGDSTPRYRRYGDGRVQCRGLIKTTGAGLIAEQGNVITTLPPGYRPDSRLILGGTMGSQAGGHDHLVGWQRIDVYANGEVVLNYRSDSSYWGLAGSWLSLSLIGFHADQ